MKKATITVVTIVLVMLAISSVRAEMGTIRISPSTLMTVGGPTTYEIWVDKEDDPTYAPHILLAMTQECWESLGGPVGVSWAGDTTSFAKSDFSAAYGAYIPLSGASEGGRYSVYSLKTHLGVDVTAPVYWVVGDFLSAPLHTTPHQTFTITLPSTSPKMLVLAIGKTTAECGPFFDNRVPPEPPSFSAVPEPSTILLALALFAGLSLYTSRKKTQLPQQDS